MVAVLRHQRRRCPLHCDIAAVHHIAKCYDQNGPILAIGFRTEPLAGRGAERMIPSQFTDAQKTFIIDQAQDGTSVGEVSRKAGIS